MVRTKIWCTALSILICADSGLAAEDLSGIFKTHIVYEQVGTTARSVSVGDVDGDMDLDLMVAEGSTGVFRWYENDGSGIPSFTRRNLGGGRRDPLNVFTADINGDTFMDVVALSTVDDTLSYYASDGQPDPTFTSVIIDADPTPNAPKDGINGYSDAPRIASAGDLDGDGDLDIAVASVDDDKVAWYENEGATWTPHTLTDSLDGSRAVWVADLDGDDDMDVIGGPWFSNTLYWYENDGNPEPNFTERVMVTFPENPNPLPSLEDDYERDEPIEDGLMWRMMTADMDNDGDTDVIAARRNQGVVEWYENDGGEIPQWTRHTIVDQYIAGKSIYPMDVDMDGHMDMVFAARGNSQISWYHNQGNGTSFEEYILYRGITDPENPQDDINFGARSVFGGDLDNDGDMDFAWIGLGSGVVAWEENLTIQMHADFDRDRDVDADDLAEWEASQGVDGGADANGDGISSAADFLIWQRQFTGSLSPPIAAAVETVPEPASAFLLSLVLMASASRTFGRATNGR